MICVFMQPFISLGRAIIDSQTMHVNVSNNYSVMHVHTFQVYFPPIMNVMSRQLSTMHGFMVEIEAVYMFREGGRERAVTCAGLEQLKNKWSVHYCSCGICFCDLCVLCSLL